MERNDLLNLLYVERQRLSEQNNQIGWSIWILIGGIITLSWMLLEHYETAIRSNAFEFCWSQVIALFGDFITIAFALLLIKNYYSDRETDYRSDRFNKSKLPIFIIFDMTIAVLLSIFYAFSSYGNILMTIMISCFVGIKYAELYQYLRTKQQIPLIFKQYVYIFAFVGVLVIGGYRIYMHSNYFIVNTKYALLSCGIIIVLYILFCHTWNPVKERIIAIDKLVDSIIINESIDIKLAYNEFIAIKLGYKYSQLFKNGLQEIAKLLKKQDRIITLIREKIEKLELIQNRNMKMLEESMKSFCDFQKENNIIADKSVKIISKIEGDLKYIPLNEENKIEIEKLCEIINKNSDNFKKNCGTISELSDRFEKIINKQKEEYNNCSNYCRFANNRFLCYSHRILHYLKNKVK